MQRVNYFLSLIFASALLTACGTSDATSPDDMPDPGPATAAKLQVDFSYIEVVTDCDGVEGDGDFQFEVFTQVIEADGSDGEGAGTVLKSSHNLGDGGRTASIGRRIYTVTRQSGSQVWVHFKATELDRDIFGSTFSDSRLNGANNVIKHVFDGSTWSNVGPRTITLGSSGCVVRMLYTANAL